MKFSIKIKELLAAYIIACQDEFNTPKYLCNFVNRKVLQLDRSIATSCEASIHNVFSRYFKTINGLETLVTIAGWFVQGQAGHGDGTEIIDDYWFIELIDGTKIEVPYAYSNGQELRILMMKHIVDKNPDEFIEFETIAKD